MSSLRPDEEIEVPDDRIQALELKVLQLRVALEAAAKSLHSCARLARDGRRPSGGGFGAVDRGKKIP